MELIKITERNGNKVVSAKELYDFLGLNRAVWSRWSKTNITDNHFAIENEDWVGVQHNVEGNITMDYAISIEFAKKLSMMARTEKGEEARKYFIECERLSKANISEYISSLTKKDFIQMALEAETRALELEAQNERLLKSNANLRTGNEVLKQIVNTDELLTMDETAKIINVEGMGRNTMFKKLREAHILNSSNIPLQEYVNRGYFKVKEKLIKRTEKDFMVKYTLVTQKGLMWLCKYFNVDIPKLTLNKAQ